MLQGIEVKCIAVIFFPTVDCSYHVNNFNERVYIVAFCCVETEYDVNFKVKACLNSIILLIFQIL